ncbi:hypothetical protein ACFX19_028908 [Malus domestica]
MAAAFGLAALTQTSQGLLPDQTNRPKVPWPNQKPAAFWPDVPRVPSPIGCAMKPWSICSQPLLLGLACPDLNLASARLPTPTQGQRYVGPDPCPPPHLAQKHAATTARITYLDPWPVAIYGLFLYQNSSPNPFWAMLFRPNANFWHSK